MFLIFPNFQIYTFHKSFFINLYRKLFLYVSKGVNKGKYRISSKQICVTVKVQFRKSENVKFLIPQNWAS